MVTQSRLIVGGKTYAMRNISSVSNIEIESSKTFPGILMFIGLLMLFGPKVFGFVLIGVGAAIWYMLKNTFAVRISSNSGEANALESKSSGYIQDIVDAINQAMIYRG